MSRGPTTRWAGGYIRRGTYYILRRVQGVRYEVSTRCTTERAALEQLARFEASPALYDPDPPAPAALLLDVEHARRFLAWSREKGNTPAWVKKQQSYLAWWAERLAGVNLRTHEPLRLLRESILPALDGATARQHRIAVLKAFFGWLREEAHELTAAEDPTHGTLTAPVVRPDQWTKTKAAPDAHAALVQPLLRQPYGDGFRVLNATGWHVTELQRFAEGGAVLPLARLRRVAQDGRAGRRAAAAVLELPQTKGGAPMRIEVSEGVAAAARRLRERGRIDRNMLLRELKRVCGALGIETIRPGWMRHTVATRAVESGASPEAVAAFLGHKSTRTTLRFYATHAVRRNPFAR